VTSTIAIAKVRHATFLHLWFHFLLCSNSWLKKHSWSVHFLRFKFALHSTEILNCPLITCLRGHVTEYCALIGMHSTVRANKLLYGHVPDPFPLCGTGSGKTNSVVHNPPALGSMQSFPPICSSNLAPNWWSGDHQLTSVWVWLTLSGH